MLTPNNVSYSLIGKSLKAVLFTALLFTGMLVVTRPAEAAQQDFLTRGFCWVGSYSPNDYFYDYSYVSLRDCYRKAQQYTSSSTDGYGHGTWENSFSNTYIRFSVNEYGNVDRWNGYGWVYQDFIGRNTSNDGDQNNIVRNGYCEVGPYSNNSIYYDVSFGTLRDCYKKAQQYTGSSIDGWGYGKWKNSFTNDQIHFSINWYGTVDRWDGYQWVYHDTVQ